MKKSASKKNTSDPLLNVEALDARRENEDLELIRYLSEIYDQRQIAEILGDISP